MALKTSFNSIFVFKNRAYKRRVYSRLANSWFIREVNDSTAKTTRAIAVFNEQSGFILRWTVEVGQSSFPSQPSPFLSTFSTHVPALD